jgi:hypothetical protein
MAARPADLDFELRVLLMEFIGLNIIHFSKVWKENAPLHDHRWPVVWFGVLIEQILWRIP